MVVVVVVLAIVSALVLVLLWTTRRQLAAQRALTSTAEASAGGLAAELVAVGAARDDAESRCGGAEGRAAAAETRIAELSEQLRLAASGLDADVVWALEKARSERTWRYSVAVDPDGSAFTEPSAELLEALHIEADAAREDVGAFVEIDAQLPAEVTSAGALLTLRAVQELLAGVMRRSESTTVHVRVDGRDLVVDVEAVGDDSERIEPDVLSTPESAAFQTTPTGARIRNAVASPPPG